jgi:ubiquitin fusion degradation protein 1
LEKALRQYSTLNQGDIIAIQYNEHVYELLCMETKPGNSGISIIETDLEVRSCRRVYSDNQVDFAAPVGYEEPKKKPIGGPAAVCVLPQALMSGEHNAD